MTEPVAKKEQPIAAIEKPHSFWDCEKEKCKQCGIEHYDFHAKNRPPTWDCGICQRNRRRNAEREKEETKKRKAEERAEARKAKKVEQMKKKST